MALQAENACLKSQRRQSSQTLATSIFSPRIHSQSHGSKDVALRNSLNVEGERQEKEEEKEGSSFFENFNLTEQSMSNLRSRGIEKASRVQELCYAPIRAGEDVIAVSPTGTGKTLAYALPLLDSILEEPPDTSKNPRVLVIAPSRELANQIEREFRKTGGKNVSVVAVTGGSNMHPQVQKIKEGVDVVVGTPGRIVDLVSSRQLSCSSIEVLVLDEADVLLQQGFAPEIDSILESLPRFRRTQKLMFGATLPPKLLRVAQDVCRRPVMIDSSGLHRSLAKVAKEEEEETSGISHVAIRAAAGSRAEVITDLLLTSGPRRAIVFANTKLEAVELANELTKSSTSTNVDVLHGDLPQFQRNRVMRMLREGDVSVLVATDVASRGIDVADLDLVVQCGVPLSASGAMRRKTKTLAEVVNTEVFVHRSGRTGRMGRSGTSVLLWDPTAGEEKLVQALERSAKVKFDYRDAPGPEEKMSAMSRRTRRRMEEVDEAVVRLFMKEAESLYESSGLSALARALALVNGVTSPPSPRSLLDNRRDFLTVKATPKKNADGSSRKLLPSSVLKVFKSFSSSKKLGKVTCCADGSCLFDLPSNLADQICKENLEDEDIDCFTIIDSLEHQNVV
uniref:RNA helicase n=1 Tax=Guillardia theta TaxID=55529 RepID=A0A7S4P9F4_GUITH